MSSTDIDIDSRIDWLSFYDPRLEKAVKHGDRLQALCPFHDNTKTGALSVNLKTGQYKCHTCDAKGNAYTFLQQREGMTEAAARDVLHSLAGIVHMDTRAGAKRPVPKYTVEEYATSKGLDPEFLRGLGITCRGASVIIPYLTESGETIATRYRWHKDRPGPRFTWKGGSKIVVPYGIWHRAEWAKAGSVVLVEGESDPHACWSAGFLNVVGVPGAKMFKQEWAELVVGLNVYIHREPGQGGEEFVNHVAQRLAAGPPRGEGVEVRVFETGGGVKDPSDLYRDDREHFADRWTAAVNSGTLIDVTKIATEGVEAVPGAPFQPKLPAGWIISKQGVHYIEDGDKGMQLVCPVPLVLSRRLRSIDTGEEKIELAYSRDNEWHRISSERSTVFASRSIIMLADRGLPITSESARMVVKYLGALEAENLDRLPIAQSVERMGWVGASKFLPGHSDDVVLDTPPGTASLADAYTTAGSYDEWKMLVAAVRIEFDIARFMLSASFAAPLLRSIRQRVFIVHFWGQSRGGKTAALKLALSAWGEPDQLIASFNATKVGLERLASFYNDLPLGVDERQVVGDKNGFVEGLVYLLGMGKGKTRGSRGGGLQSNQTWRTIALTTGEEPLSRESSHTGIKTRVLELYGQPMGDEKFARMTHREVGKNYGHAGPMFVGRLIEYAREHGNSQVELDYDSIYAKVEALSAEHMVAHISAIATVCLADMYFSQWFMEYTREQAEGEAVQLAERVLGMVETEQESDYAERAWEWIEGWLRVNRVRFVGDSAPREQWGFRERVQGQSAQTIFWVTPSVFEEHLRDAGYTSRRVLRDISSLGRIESEQRGGKTRYKVRKSWGGERVSMIGIRLDDADDGDSGVPFGGGVSPSVPAWQERKDLV